MTAKVERHRLLDRRRHQEESCQFGLKLLRESFACDFRTFGRRPHGSLNLLNELFGFECSRRSHFLLQEIYVLVTFAVTKIDLQKPTADETASKQDY